MEKLISIVLPVFNGEKYLRESIESVIGQTYSNWELLIVDDCSNDRTPEIAQEYAGVDQRISYYRNDVNLRLPRNLNKGFSLAKGEYLTWTSDDNNYKPHALEKMYKALEEDREAQFVFASCRIIDGDSNEIEYMMVQQDSPQYIVGGNVVGACFMYTREVYEEVGEYNPELMLVEDLDYWQRICMKFKAIGIEEILYEYRWHDGTLTNTMRRDIFNNNLERMLLKNRKGFGHLNIKQNYGYYKKLFLCRKNRNSKTNPYLVKYSWYLMLCFILYSIPDKIKRMLK